MNKTSQLQFDSRLQFNFLKVKDASFLEIFDEVYRAASPVERKEFDVMSAVASRRDDFIIYSTNLFVVKYYPPHKPPAVSEGQVKEYPQRISGLLAPQRREPYYNWIGCGGIAKYWTRRPLIWAIFKDLTNNKSHDLPSMYEAARYSKHAFSEYFKHEPYLHNYCLAENLVVVRWLKYLGFSFTGEYKYVAGERFVKFELVQPRANKESLVY